MTTIKSFSTIVCAVWFCSSASCAQKPQDIDQALLGKWHCEVEFVDDADGSIITTINKSDYKTDGTFVSESTTEMQFNGGGGDIEFFIQSHGTYKLFDSALCFDTSDLEVSAFNLDNSNYYTASELIEFSNVMKSSLEETERCRMHALNINENHAQFQIDDDQPIDCRREF